jgi:hypothetical protein
MYETKLNYTDIKIGKILFEIIIACNLTKTSDYNKGIKKKIRLLFKLRF